MNDRTPNDAIGRNGGLVFFLCFLIAVFEGFDLQVIGVAAPQLMRELGLSPAQSGFAFSASLAGLAIGAVCGGRLADRIGRKPSLVASVAIFGVLTLLTEFASGFGSLVVLRLLTGIGLGGSMPNIIAIVSETAARRNKTFAVSAMSCGLAIGGVVVALLARSFPDIGWRGLFVVGGILPLLLVPALWAVLPETLRRPGAKAISAGAAHTLFGQGMAWSTLSLWLVFALTLLQLSLLLNWLPTLVIARGFAREQAMIAATVLNLGSVAGALSIGWLCDRFGAKRPMLAIYAVMALALYGLSLASQFSTLLGLAFVAGFTVLGAQFALYGLSPRIYPEAGRGLGVGAAVAVGRLGAIAGPLIAGVMIGRGASGGQVLLLMVPLVVLAGVAMLLLGQSAGEQLSVARDPA
jgi:AAHS family 3-hydroxyphenylpropionic acid transporter